MKTSIRYFPNKPAIALLASFALVAVFLVATPSFAQSEGVRATLLIYSGRENPSIELDSAEISQLRAFVGDLQANPQFEGSSVNPSILGYSGFVVVNESNAPGIPEYLAIYGSDVEATGEEGARFLRDDDRNIENWIVQRFVARDLIDEQALRLIRSAR